MMLDAAKTPVKAGKRWNASRCFCGRNYRNGSRTAISSSKPVTGRQFRFCSCRSLAHDHRPHVHGSYKKCLKSWTYLHNESVNIFSHLIGSLLFLTLPFGIYKELAPRYATANKADLLVFASFFLGVAICFALSTMYAITLDPFPLLIFPSRTFCSLKVNTNG